MEDILKLMFFLGAFIFMSMGLTIANSIETKKSKKIGNIMTFIAMLGMFSFLIGLIGLIIFTTFYK